MTCPSPIVLSMYADRELAPAEAREVQLHLTGCAECRARTAALQQEAHELRAALASAGKDARVPPFERPIGAFDLVVFGAGAAAIAWGAGAVWSAIGAAIPAGLQWLDPFGLGTLVDLVISFIVYFAFEDTTMLSSTIEVATIATLIALLAGSVLVARKPRAGTTVTLSLILLVLVMPSLGRAVEIRHSDVTTVPAGETVDDTLIAIGDSVSIDGTVNGDLIAFARRVTVRGHVAGDVISGAETVSIEGSIDGNVFGFGRTVTLGKTAVMRNVYGFGRDVTIGSEASVAGDATTVANDADVSGRVGRDLLSVANELAVSGNIERDMETYGAKVTIVPPGRIGGDITAHVPAADKLTVSSGATVGGQVRTDVREIRRAERNRYLTGWFYARQAIRVGAAFLAGLLLFWIFPGLRTLVIGSGADAVKKGTIGLVTLVMLPVLSIIACITIFGIPIGIAGFIIWLLGLYFAKIVVAQTIGRALFKSPVGYPHYAATLISGLVIVIVSINIPWIGWLANLALTCVGLGLLGFYAAGVRERAEAL